MALSWKGSDPVIGVREFESHRLRQYKSSRRRTPVKISKWKVKSAGAGLRLESGWTVKTVGDRDRRPSSITKNNT